ncbi:MAG: SpoIIIAH-like family protein [Clostridia bacterium]|nr:SpoIIIAH-like family protein [Clostridia bacterium]
MKKGKVLTKGQLALVLMVAALGAAVWMNMRFSSNKYLGEATYVDKTENKSAVQTSAKPEQTDDYFETVKKERQSSRKKIEDELAETLKSERLTEEDKKTVAEKSSMLADRAEKENNIESLLKAKGFPKAVAFIGDDTVNIVVQSDGLTASQTLQIQDIAVDQTSVNLAKIKIVSVK